MLRKLAFRLTLAAALVGAVTLSGPVISGAAADPHVVPVRDFQFGDGTPGGNMVTIETGEKIRWEVVNGTHKIVSDDPPSFPGSGTLDANDPNNDAHEVTFDAPGDYAYHCELHPEMTGVVKVVDPPPTTTSTAPTTTTTAPPATTTTTRPPTTTTTAHGPTTTTTLPPTTNTTTAHPGTTTTTPPTVAAGVPTLTTPTTAGPAPTTTTGKSKEKKAPGSTTTTSKNRKGAGKNEPGQPPAAPTDGEQPAPDGSSGDVPLLDSGDAVPTTDFEAAAETGDDQQAASSTEHDQPKDRHGMHLLLGTGVIVTLLGLGALGYKWRTRDSAYWAA